MGTVWILQGAGVLPVGFMAHIMKWATCGLGLDIRALVLFIAANRRRKTPLPSARCSPQTPVSFFGGCA
jgi:hypothetical protein